MQNTMLFVCLLLVSFSSVGDDDTQTLPTPQTMSINGAMIHYIDTGEPETETNKKPVLFVHGTLGDFRIWQPQINALSTDRRVISYSRRYHHPNSWPEDERSKGFSPSVHADDLTLLIETLDVKGVDLVGHSFGAVVALLVARDRDDLIDTLTVAEPPLVSIVGRPADRDIIRRHFNTAVLPAIGALSNERHEEEEVVRRFVNGALGGDAFDQLPQQIRMRMMDNVSELKGSLREGATIPPFTCMEARNITIPTLIIEGDNSPAMFRLVAKTLKDCLPNGTLVTIENASHGMPFMNPLSFNELTISFLNKHR